LFLKFSPRLKHVKNNNKLFNTKLHIFFLYLNKH